ncbi:MAG: polysaccharide biosynthesis/export protein [Acidobacteriota bacterium]|jgi:polysaccharide export outer membrane protein|nr:polysaccharide biosynthesis/export protein [Acidobacteriota bacterium]MDT5262687.1 polysaccharide biosynthesis/export protein [Acidobacteriota bacterium]
MKSNPRIAATLSLVLLMLAPTAALAQKQKKNEKHQQPAQKAAQKPQADERLEPDDKSVVRPDVPEDVQANRRERMSEETDAEIPYYNNFLTTYRLGPEDVISVSVFGLDKYSKTGITVPPDGRIDYYFVRDGLHVAGKTTQQVADEIARNLDEYIKEPKVTVSLDKAMSTRYGVIGDVAKPGIMIMSHRLSVLEALNEAGGVLSTGDKKKVVVLHWNADRMVQQIPVNVSAIERGQAPDNYFLSPGDQIVVPGNRFKSVQKVLSLLPVLSFARIFTGGF